VISWKFTKKIFYTLQSNYFYQKKKEVNEQGDKKFL